MLGKESLGSIFTHVFRSDAGIQVGTAGWWPGHLNLAYPGSLSKWLQTSCMEACGSKGECPKRTRQKLCISEVTQCVSLFTIVPD